jgi:putative oxidoreductase
MDIGLLIIRLVLGLVIAGHGAQKLFGWFGGYGLRGIGGGLASRGFYPPAFWAFAGGVSEFGGGLLFAAGLLSPLGAIGIAAAMLTAVSVFHWPKFWNEGGGFEYPLVNLATAIGVGIAGPGAYSLDAAFGTSLPRTASLIIAALVALGYLTGMVMSARNAPSGDKASGNAAA